MLGKNGVYDIKCQDCNALYIGQCVRTLKHRVKEHVNCFSKRDKTTGFRSEEYKITPLLK